MDNPFFKQLETQAQGTCVDLKEVLPHLAFNDEGLIPVIAQQYDSKEVLMMAWMNKEALLLSCKEQRMCYWSRSRKALWRKGESSGHTQRLVQLRIDCDGDALLCLVDQTQAACHTFRRHCFYAYVEGEQVVIESSPGHATEHSLTPPKRSNK